MTGFNKITPILICIVTFITGCSTTGDDVVRSDIVENTSSSQSDTWFTNVIHEAKVLGGPLRITNLILALEPLGLTMTTMVT